MVVWWIVRLADGWQWAFEGGYVQVNDAGVLSVWDKPEGDPERALWFVSSPGAWAWVVPADGEHPRHLRADAQKILTMRARHKNLASDPSGGQSG